MDPITSTIASVLTTRLIQDLAGKLGESTIESLLSFNQIVREKLRGKGDSKLKEILASGENNGFDSLSDDDLATIAESLGEEMDEDPKFAQDFQARTKDLLGQIKADSPDVANELNHLNNKLLKRLKKIQDELSDMRGEVAQITANIHNADFIGRDNALFSGGAQTVHYNFYGNAHKLEIKNGSEPFSQDLSRDDSTINSNFYSQAHNDDQNFYESKNRRQYFSKIDPIEFERLTKQIERIRAGLTKAIPVEARLIKLENIRQPKPIFNHNVLLEQYLQLISLILSRSFSVFLDAKSMEKSNENKEKMRLIFRAKTFRAKMIVVY
jgi:hypothetical protein